MGFLETAITLSSTCFSVFNAWTCWGQNKEKKSDDEQDEKTSQGREGKAGVQKGSQSICYLSQPQHWAEALFLVPVWPKPHGTTMKSLC